MAVPVSLKALLRVTYELISLGYLSGLGDDALMKYLLVYIFHH